MDQGREEIERVETLNGASDDRSIFYTPHAFGHASRRRVDALAVGLFLVLSCPLGVRDRQPDECST